MTARGRAATVESERDRLTTVDRPVADCRAIESASDGRIAFNLDAG